MAETTTPTVAPLVDTPGVDSTAAATCSCTQEASARKAAVGFIVLAFVLLGLIIMVKKAMK